MYLKGCQLDLMTKPTIRPPVYERVVIGTQLTFSQSVSFAIPTNKR